MKMKAPAQRRGFFVSGLAHEPLVRLADLVGVEVEPDGVYPAPASQGAPDGHQGGGQARGAAT
ncbi:hypothetical protein [Fundidesulfovibrio magnetotacticus]|uniref:hypothetical protein n=1 Tax=Fundidesulfovibrio magnetotacticus TaxID=2730080 RepID=UPI001566337B|nr:hypothetical protein [Fundidesulfovibrio magnetotacticus]